MLTVKNPPKNQIRNFVKFNVRNYVCNGLTDFDKTAIIFLVSTPFFRSKISNEIGSDWRKKLHHWNPFYIRVSMELSVFMHSHARLSILPLKKSNLRAKKNIDGNFKTTFLSISQFISLIRPIRWDSQISSISVIYKKF